MLRFSIFLLATRAISSAKSKSSNLLVNFRLIPVCLSLRTRTYLRLSLVSTEHSREYVCVRRLSLPIFNCLSHNPVNHEKEEKSRHAITLLHPCFHIKPVGGGGLNVRKGVYVSFITLSLFLPQIGHRKAPGATCQRPGSRGPGTQCGAKRGGDYE